MVRRFYAVGSSLPFVVGTALRLWNLRDQILGGDETHAIRAALNFTLPKILVTYQVTDNCIPLTAIYKLFLLAGMPLTETLLRLPVLLCGLAALLALPAALEGRLNRGTVLLYRWLLAISPALVLYSRIARSYMPMVLLSFGAVMAFEAWWRTRSWRSGAAYVFLGALAVWFHLGAGPIVAAPFLFAAGDALIQRQDLGRNLRHLLLLGLGIAAAFALFLVPAMGSLLEVVAGKRVEQSVPWGAALSGILRLQAGTAAGWLAILFWLAALAGLALLIRSERRLALFTVTMVMGHVAGLLVLSPFGLANPVIFGRYLLPVLPFVLLWVAAVFGTLGKAGGVASVPFLTVLLAAGPFADRAVLRTSFLHHNDFVGFYKPRPAVPADIPDFYRQLHGETVVEFPWTFIWEANRAFYLYQEVHGGRVIVSTPQRLLFQPGLALRNAVAPEPAAICRGGARYLIVHRAEAREEDGITPDGRLAEGEDAQALRHLLREEAATLGERVKREWGPAVYADGVLRAWDLRTACGAPQKPTPAASAAAARASPATKLPGR
jgi:hypothetical protein